jgi:hypothetical protein
VSEPRTSAAGLVEEAMALLERGADTPLRLLGGLAIEVAAPGELLLPRTYNDVDFIGGRGTGPSLAALFEELGYDGDHRFNALHGHRRLLFYAPEDGHRVDVFVGRFEMCHTWPLERRLTVRAQTIPLADLLLTKLQIFAINEKDQRDAVNLVHGHQLSGDEDGINADYIASLCAADWGLWRTVTLNIERIRSGLSRYELQPEHEAVVVARLDDLRRRIDAEPKSTKWKLRARVGERVQWYEEPEEVG